MPRNIEIKAVVRDPGVVRDRVRAASEGPCESVMQEDVFFVTPTGRLKLRIPAPNRGELIFYEREDTTGPKESRYAVATTDDPGLWKTLLSSCLGVRGVVRKRREVYRVGGTRIHLDDVEGLGNYLEFEVAMAPGQDMADGRAIARELMTRFGIEEADLVAGAYIDLLGARKRQIAIEAIEKTVSDFYRTKVAEKRSRKGPENLGG